MRDGDGTGSDSWDDDLAETAWVSGVEVIAGWVEADTAAKAFREVLMRLGIPEETFRVAAGTAAEGEGSVRFKGSPELFHWIGWMLAHADVASIPDSPYFPPRDRDQRSLDVREPRREEWLNALFPGSG